MSSVATMPVSRLRRAFELCRRELTDLKRGELWQVLHGLGGLATWWLRPDVIESLASPFVRPDLPGTRGACWIVLAQPESRPWPLLREAMFLPLEWREEPTHGRGLPAQLATMATEIARSLEKPGWGVHLHPSAGIDGVDLTGIEDDLDFRSGWAGVAAGLLVCTEGGEPNPGVCATGDWDWQRGILPVSRIPAKLAVAREWNIQECYVPKCELDKARQHADFIQVAPLNQGVLSVRAALREYAFKLVVPPPPPSGANDVDAFNRCAEYWERYRFQEPGKKYYWSHLLPTIIERHRQQLRSDYPGWAPTHLVSIVSGSYELVPMVAESIGCRQCLLLYTSNKIDAKQDQTKAMTAVKTRLESLPVRIDCVPGEFTDSGQMTEDIPCLVRRFLDGVPPGDAVFDVTPGTGWMRWVVDRAMPARSWRIYVHHDTLTPADQKPKPGSERLVVWNAGV